MNVLVWFTRDLRVADHPALAMAAGSAVLPVYIVEPDLWRQPDRSARQWSFAADCLGDLRADLAGLGLPLVVRLGEAAECFVRLLKQYKIGRIVSLVETGCAWSRARDARLGLLFRAQGVEWVRLPPGAAEVGGLTAVRGAEPGLIPSAQQLRLAEDRCPHRQIGGRSQGLAVLEAFLARRKEQARAGQTRPGAGEGASSRLSPYLAFGALSVGEVAAAIAVRQADRPGGSRARGLAAVQARLVWRDQAMAAAQAVDLPGPVADAGRLAAFAAGQTGLPFVDACLRYVAATGWLGFPLRGMLASVAVHHLGLDWRVGGAQLARWFTDYEPAIHWGQCRATAERVLDPVRQGQTLDPDGLLVRAWVPELAEVPTEFVHCPWKWPGARQLLGRRYPEPLVDVAAAAQQARRAIHAARGGSGREGTASRRPTGPDSRADPGGAPDRSTPPQTQRKPRATPVPSAQLGFDF